MFGTLLICERSFSLVSLVRSLRPLARLLATSASIAVNGEASRGFPKPAAHQVYVKCRWRKHQTAVGRVVFFRVCWALVRVCERGRTHVWEITLWLLLWKISASHAHDGAVCGGGRDQGTVDDTRYQISCRFPSSCEYHTRQAPGDVFRHSKRVTEHHVGETREAWAYLHRTRVVTH